MSRGTGRFLRAGAMTAGLIGVLGLSPACLSEASPIRHPDRMSLWVQTLEPADVTGTMDFCARHQLNLNVNVMRGQWDDAELASLCEAAERRDVALRLWPVLPHEEGYWANQENAARFVAFVDELLAKVPSRCPRLDGIVYDVEMPFQRFAEMERRRAEGQSNLEILSWLLAGVDEDAFLAARAQFAASVERVHARGLMAQVTTLPQNADDYADGDETVARAMWTPIEGIDWDQVAFQVYRNLFEASFPSPNGGSYTPGLITSYARTARAAYGEKAALDLGMAGAGPRPEDGLGAAAELQADLAAALAEGLTPSALSIFALDGLRALEDAAAWVQVPAPRAAEPTEADDGLRALFGLLDSLDD